MSGGIALVIDELLLTAILGLGWGALSARSPRQAVVLFIAFGLVMALAWARLNAPDVALAEAAIGAGLSGALLLTALRDQPARIPSGTTDSPSGAPAPGRWASLLVTLLSLGLAAVFGWAYVEAVGEGGPARLADDVLTRVGESGVSNPVTAVLLNFRAYDTLLELAVLLVALLGILALGPERPRYRAAGPMLGGLTQWLVPVLIVTGGYLLWVGAHAPGGAFQAGAVLAAAGVVLRLAGVHSAGLPSGSVLRLSAIGGVGVFLAVGLALMVAGRPFLAYPAAWAGTLILLIEAAATLAIATTLIAAFLGGCPPGWHRSEGSARTPIGSAGEPTREGPPC